MKQRHAYGRGKFTGYLGRRELLGNSGILHSTCDSVLQWGQARLKYQETLNAIYARLDRLGDLPVFSATVNRIRQVSSSRQSDAMALAMAVMKDANLSAKLLKIANTHTYNRGNDKISAVSRAVVLLGFERIHNLCMTLKLIESFRDQQPDSGIEQLLIRAFLNASIAREMASAAGTVDMEETYICGLLYGLGEIIVAFTLPDTYREMLRLRALGREGWPRIQLQSLGGHFSDIGQDLAQSWGFPKTVVQAMDPLTADQLQGKDKLNHRLAVGCHDLLELIYRHDMSNDLSYTELMLDLASLTRQPVDSLDQHVNEAFRQVCDLAQEYGLRHSIISPRIEESDDTNLDETTRKLAYYVHSREAKQGTPDAGPAVIEPSRSDEKAHWMEQQLVYLQRLNELISDQAGATRLLEVAVEAIVKSCALERATFCMLGGQGKELRAKLISGLDGRPLRQFFQLRRDEEWAVLFFRLMDKRMTLLVPDTDEPGWRDRLPVEFMNRVDPRGFIMAPLVVNDRAIGLMYADKISPGSIVEDQEFRVFNQFLVQARLGLEVLHHRR